MDLFDAAPPQVGVRFLVVREMPLVAIDLVEPSPGPTLLLDGSLFQSATERGLLVLRGFYGVNMPQGARLGFTLRGGELVLEDDGEIALLKLPREAVAIDWVMAAKRMTGSILVVGSMLGLTPDDTPKQVADRIDVAARAGRVAGAIVGVAEPTMRLPMLFG